MSVLDDALARPALTVDGRDHSVADVAVAALHVSEWAGVLERSALAGEAPEEDVRAAAASFRRRRRLLSADEMEAWLARRGLSAGVWMRWVRADVARGAGATGRAVEPDAVALYAEALCSGALARAAGRLAELLVAPEPDGAPPAPPADPAPLAALGIDLDRARDLLATLSARDAALQRLAESVATPQALEERIRSHQTEWLAVEYRRLVVDEEPAAREALLCVRDDGMTLEEVAGLAGAPLSRERAFLADTPPELREHLLSASPGEPVGPLGGDAAVLIVDAKDAPGTDDPEVVRRAREELLERALEREITARVRWHDRL
jgi:hypothetical protein